MTKMGLSPPGFKDGGGHHPPLSAWSPLLPTPLTLNYKFHKIKFKKN